MSRLPWPRACAAFLFVFAALASPTEARDCNGESWIRLEVTAGEMAGNEAAEWVEIDRDGCVLSGYPSWDTRAGVYQRTMPGSELAGLTQTLASQRIMAFDEKSARAAIEASASKASGDSIGSTVYTISGADRYRLMIDDGSGWKTITWRSPMLELEHRRDIAKRSGHDLDLDDLQRLVTVIEAVRRQGDHPGKMRVAETTP